MELKFKHFIFLNILDIITTWYALTILNLSEANPVINFMISFSSLITALIIVKIFGITILYIWYFILPQKYKLISLIVMCLLYIVVIINNIYQIIV